MSPGGGRPFAAARSGHPVSAHAAGEVVGAVIEALGTHPDLAVLLVSAGHAGALEDIGAAVRTLLQPSVLLGAASEAVVGPDGDPPVGPGMALWCGLVGPVVPLLLGPGHPRPAGPAFAPAAAILLGDATSPAPSAWGPLPGGAAGAAPVVVGGATTRAGLLVQDRLVSGAAVGALIGPATRPLVVSSEGGRDFGGPLEVTRAEGTMLYELDGRPALERLMELIADRLPAADVGLVNAGLRVALLGTGSGGAGAGAGLVVRGADRSNGALALLGEVPDGTHVRFQVRDPRTASEAWHDALGAADPATAAALLVRGTGRSRHWFAEGGVPADGDALVGVLPGTALAGCATSSQLGPAPPGGRPPAERATAMLFAAPG